MLQNIRAYFILSVSLWLASEFMLILIFTVKPTMTLQNFTTSLTSNCGLLLHNEFNNHFEQCIKYYYILCTYLLFMEV